MPNLSTRLYLLRVTTALYTFLTALQTQALSPLFLQEDMLSPVPSHTGRLLPLLFPLREGFALHCRFPGSSTPGPTASCEPLARRHFLPETCGKGLGWLRCSKDMGSLLGLFHKPEFSKSTWALTTGLLGDRRERAGSGPQILQARPPLHWLLRGGKSDRASPTPLHERPVLIRKEGLLSCVTRSAWGAWGTCPPGHPRLRIWLRVGLSVSTGARRLGPGVSFDGWTGWRTTALHAAPFNSAQEGGLCPKDDCPSLHGTCGKTSLDLSFPIAQWLPFQHGWGPRQECSDVLAQMS